MNQFDKKKSCYLQPRMKVVSFNVEEGFQVSPRADIISLSIINTQEYNKAFSDNDNAVWGGSFGNRSFGTAEYNGIEAEW